jgi:UDP-glucose 4-epimerase
VTDLADAHIDALNYLENGGESVIVNLGSEDGFSIREITNFVKDITEKNFAAEEGPRREGDIVISIASSDKAKKVLGWNKKYSDIKTILKTAWEWEKKSKGEY